MGHSYFRIFLFLILVSIIGILFPNFSLAVLEDFTTYTEVDTNNHITVSSSTVTFSLNLNELSYIYTDKGVDYFSGDFEHLLEIKMTDNWYGQVYLWALSNAIGDIRNSEGVYLYMNGGEHVAYTLRLGERYTGNIQEDAYNITINTPYYLKIKRTGNTLNAYVYSDGARTNLLDTSTLTSSNVQSYRYLYVAQSVNISRSDLSISGYVKNLGVERLLDTTPPGPSNGQPTGTLTAGATQTTVSLATDESATCKYSTTAGTSYDSMLNTFTTTGDTSHSTLVTGLINGQSYSYYVRCSDTSGNKNTDDFLISFSIAEPIPPDTTPPVISIVQSSNITVSGAAITWTTDDLSNSVVNYGLTTSFGSTQTNSSLVTNHSINLTGLSSNTTHYYQVRSCNSDNYCANSSTYNFTTFAPPAVGATTVGTLALTPTIENIGVISSFAGDTNANNQVVLEYREVGTATWKLGIPMTVDRRENYNDPTGPKPNPWKNQWRSVIFWLTPNTNYEVRITYSDADGVSGSNPVTATIKTRNDNPSSNGTNYYVSTTGSDNNPGTQVLPFRTIQKAANTAVAGDVINIMPGTYNEQVSPANSGTVDNYITYQSYDMNNKAVIDGQKSRDYGFVLSGKSYIRIRGLILRNSKKNNIGLFSASNYGIIEDSILSEGGEGWGHGGILVNYSGNPPVVGTLIQRNEITRYATTSDQEMGIFFYNNSIHEGGFVIRDNVIRGNFRDGIGGSPNGAPEGTVHANTMIYRNYIEGSGDDLIEIEGADINSAVWGNTLKNSYTMALGVTPVQVGPLYIFRNIVRNWGDAAVKMGGHSDGFVYVYHNTFTTSQNTSVFADYGHTDVVDNFVVRNNIMGVGKYAIHQRHGGFLGNPQPGDTNNDYDYNNSYKGPWLDLFRWGPAWPGDVYDTLGQFQAVSGREMHGISADNKFVDAANNNFQLQSTSPNIDKGVVLFGFNDANSPWPYRGTAPDIGAHEYDSGAPPPTSSFTISTITPLYLFRDKANTLTIAGSNFNLSTDFYLRFISGGTIVSSMTSQPQSSSSFTINLTSTQVNNLSIGFYDLKIERSTDSQSQTYSQKLLITQLGDISSPTSGVRDGKVNIYDVSRMLSKWGSANATDLQDCDINPGPSNVSQNKIDLFDANKMMVNWLP